MSHHPSWIERRCGFDSPSCVTVHERYESNIFLGRHPSPTKVNLFIGAALIGHVGVSLLLPQPLRFIWQMAWIMVEGFAVSNNFRAGWQLQF